MARGRIWTGTLSFVLVSIPVEMVSAVRHNRVSFHMMHAKDNTLLKRRMYCPNHQQLIHPEHIVNGYPADDDFVIVRENEYKALEPKRSQTIEISSFIDFDDIEPVYYDRPYYLLPRKGGLKSYTLLREVLKGRNKVGIATFVLARREHLVAVWAKEDVISMMTLHFPEQIADRDELAPKKAKADAKQVKSIKKIIEDNRTDYDPTKYTDRHHKQILEFLSGKAEQQGTVSVSEEEEEAEEVEEQMGGRDLVAALEESLEKARGG